MDVMEEDRLIATFSKHELESALDELQARVVSQLAPYEPLSTGMTRLSRGSSTNSRCYSLRGTVATSRPSNAD